MSALPAAFLEAMRALLGDDFPAFLAAMDAPSALALRLNPARPNAEAAAADFVEGRVPWAAEGRYLKQGARPGASVAHAAGAFYVQEASAMAPAAVLDARPGEAVLDLCAAPGGKSTQLAAALRGRGVLVSNDPEPARARALAGNLERLGVPNAVVVNALPDRLAARWPERFDAVLADAPCSGEGMFRRDPDARSEWQDGAPEGCARRQAEILDRAAELLRPGGRLVYSTCTFNTLENEGSVEGFLARHPEFTPEDFVLEGVGESHGGMLRLFPHRLRGDGHFVARLRKAGEPRGEVPARERSRAPRRGASCPDDLMKALREQVCAPSGPLRELTPTLLGDRLYGIPALAPPLEGVKVVSPGLCLLRAGRSHIEPEHALAMALSPGEALRTLPLDAAGAEAYLRGEVLPCDGTKGWTLVTFLDMPLGWGKVSDGQLKNRLPKGLRRPAR